jgi:putative hemolysin
VLGIEWIVIAAMVALNSIFAAYEIALASVSLARLRILEHENRRGARAAMWMKDNMEASLAVVQLGITFVGAIAAATGGATAEETVSPFFERVGLPPTWSELAALTIVVVPYAVVTIVIGELLPKVFALRNKEWVCLRLSPFMSWFSFAVWPIVWLLETTVTALMSWSERRWQPKLEGHSKQEATELQELRAMAALARTLRLIGGREENIIVQAARLAARPVREIIVPAAHMATLRRDNSLSDSLVAAHLDMHTRFPVCDRPGDPETISGYVNYKDIVSQLRLSPDTPTLTGIMRPITSFPDDLPIATCLERMIQNHTHIALVRDANRHVLGMVTLEDILEELVGEINDEYDRLPTHVLPSGKAWVVGGGISLSRLREETGIELAEATRPPSEVKTLNDWFNVHLGRKVRGGEIVDHDGVRIIVRKMRRQKVMEAQISHNQPSRLDPVNQPLL